MALWQAEVIASVREMVRFGGIDLVVLEELWLHPFCALARDLGCCTVFDAHNVEARLRREIAPFSSGFVDRARARKLLQRVEAVERDLVRKADMVWCCSAADASSLASGAGDERKVRVIPNTVDMDSLRPVREGTLDPEGGHRSGPVIAFVGAFSYAPNEGAARLLVREVLPAVRQRKADASLVLIGREPTPWMLEAAQREPGVRVTGAVDDVRPFLASADVVAVPLVQGSGTRLKILEAFAARRPVVSTAKGAEGLDAVDEQHLLLREIPAFPNAILELLDDRSRASEMAGRALALVEREYSRPVAAARIRAALADFAPPATRSRSARLGEDH